MNALTDLCFLSAAFCSAVWRHLTRQRATRSFAVILLSSLGVFAITWSAISPEDDVFQQEYIRRRMPSRVLNKPTKASVVPIPNATAIASGLVKKSHFARLCGIFGSLPATDVGRSEAFQTDVSLDRAPPATT